MVTALVQLAHATTQRTGSRGRCFRPLAYPHLRLRHIRESPAQHISDVLHPCSHTNRESPASSRHWEGSCAHATV